MLVAHSRMFHVIIQQQLVKREQEVNTKAGLKRGKNKVTVGSPAFRNLQFELESDLTDTYVSSFTKLRDVFRLIASISTIIFPFNSLCRYSGNLANAADRFAYKFLPKNRRWASPHIKRKNAALDGLRGRIKRALSWKHPYYTELFIFYVTACFYECADLDF